MPLTTYTAGEVLTAASLNANLSFAASNTKIAQVVSTLKSDTFSTASTTYTDVTGLSVSITPTLNTSKILILAQFVTSISGDIQLASRLMRDAVAISIGDAASNRTRASVATYAVDGGGYSSTMLNNNSILFLDSPATTSATTYKIQIFVNTGTGFINRAGVDTDLATKTRTASNITVMEVLA